MNIPLFIARRLAHSQMSRRNKIMTRVAIISVTVSIAVMIIAISVIMGFKIEVSAKVIGFSSELQIVNLDNNNSLETVPINSTQPFTDNLKKVTGVKNITQYAQKAGVIRGDKSMHGVVLKGVDSLYDWNFFKNNLIEGSLPTVHNKEKNKDVLISKNIASKMELSLGDKFEMMFIQDKMRRDRFTVAGIYSTSLSELDEIMIITDIRNVQRLNNWGDTLISGIEVSIDDINNLQATKESVEDVVFDLETETQPLMVVDIKERHTTIFDWLEIQDINVIIIISIMLIVASFNMASITLIMLFEKSSMIGILKTIGMNNRSIRELFMYRVSYILLKGLLYGNIFGIGISMVQKYFGIIKLPASEYLISQVPISIDWWSIITLNISSFILIIIIQVIPTMIIAKLSPHVTIKMK